ncbi:MAG: polysaccharide pyruvyl transferase family protein [Scytonema sp. CRU_2_7]|nr:polysaccharide pyruvyl transferase family protein [Scytonema sp. CRU_2_7]
MEQIGRCRVVVTGSYHAGVFALAQGIPIMGLAKSEYYADKFLGLADQFGVGCEVIFLHEQEFATKLVDSIDRALESAEQLRPQLLEAAKEQVELGHTAYKRVYELVNSR